MKQLTPRQIVSALDKYIVGQDAAKRAVAVAIRNRWRRQQIPDEMRDEVAPKNILMIGPTGVGKTEIARRLAGLVNAPFLKVEATKYTEVGYQGRDVEGMVRDLVELSVSMVRSEHTEVVREQAERTVEERILEELLPGDDEHTPPEAGDSVSERRHRTREKLRQQLRANHLEDRTIEVAIEEKAASLSVLAPMGLDQMGPEVQDFFERLIPSQRRTRDMPVCEARGVIFQQEVDRLIDREKITEMAIQRAENAGIIFLDELDKVASTGELTGPDVSRQGVQRDLLPVVEGCTVMTRYGPVRTDHVLFIAAGAFRTTKPSDLMPEMQGRFPIRVELDELTQDDFVQILTEPANALVKQQVSLLATEGVELLFTDEAIQEMAYMAYRANEMLESIGARRLYTIVEKVIEEIAFYASEATNRQVVIDADYVRMRLADILEDRERSHYEL